MRGAVDMETYGLVTYAGCRSEDVFEYAKQVAQAKGKKEDPRLRRLQYTKDFEDYLKQQHNKGLFGSLDIDETGRHYTVYSKKVLVNGTRECVVKVKFDVTTRGRKSRVAKGSQPKWFRKAFMAMGVAFK